MIKSVGTASVAPAASCTTAAKPVDLKVTNFGSGITAVQKGNSLVLSGVPHASPHSYGGAISIAVGGQKEASAWQFIPVGNDPTLSQVANKLAQQVTAGSDYKATVSTGKDGCVTLHFAKKAADVAKLDRAIQNALRTGGPDNFISTAEAKKLVDLAGEGGISKGERASLQNLMMGWTYQSDESAEKSAGFVNPTLSVTAGTEIQQALWPTA